MKERAPRRRLDCPIETDLAGVLDEGDGHRLYYEESGNPSGKPVVVRHGGPGAGTSAQMRRSFDPGAWRKFVELCAEWPRAVLRITPDAGHSAFEPDYVHELVTTTDRFAGLAPAAGIGH